ncbi:MAG TPA: response regulator [Candidatus Hydrogenedentes bacterium]|nr:response regulator [Candidatus Hydrogenedentota bacterium]
MAVILIATPDATLQSIFAAEINAQGHALLWALDGKEACDLVLSDQPQLVFLDPTLPIFNAFETCRLLRDDPQSPPGLPIIILSDDDVDSRRLNKCQATACFPKTHLENDLRDLIVKYLFGH